MYSIYDRQNSNGLTQLKFSKKISLAGCNVGLIPNLLKEKLTAKDTPPIGWTLFIADNFNKKSQSVIIDIKPNNTENSEVFLCELDTVFGFSYIEWTPIMYRLKLLYSNKSPEELDKTNFIYPDNIEIIYTMLYLAGSFKNGQLTGKWIYPGRSSTNALLLWSEAMTFFHQQVKKHDPDFLNENIKTI